MASPPVNSSSAGSPRARRSFDCYGREIFPELRLVRDDVEVHYVFDEGLKRAHGPFDACILLNEAVGDRRRFLYPKERRVTTLLESPISGCYARLPSVVDDYGTVFTHQRHLVERGEPYVQLHLGTSWLGALSERPREYPKFRDISFVGSVQHGNAHGYSLRKQVAEALAKEPRVERFGYGIREIKTKDEGLLDFRFSIAMENTQSDYYVSEKLIDCIVVDTVPVYFGCPGLADMFDMRGIITFDSLPELLAVIPTLTSQRYAEMLPYARENKRRVFANGWNSVRSIYERMTDLLLPRVPPGRLPVASRISGWTRYLVQAALAS